MERRRERGADRPRGGPTARPIERRPLNLWRRGQERARGPLVRAPEADPRSDPDPERPRQIAQAGTPRSAAGG
eukprot:4199006-Alexandrium_andersonii.AAC.1